MKNQKGSVVAWTIVIIAILVVAGGIYFYSRNTSAPITPIQTTTGTPTVSVNLNPVTQNSISTTTLASTTVSVMAPTTPISNGVIKIYSISPASGPVGTEIILKGNFSDGEWAGPEYTTQAIIENSSGGTSDCGKYA